MESVTGKLRSVNIVAHLYELLGDRTVLLPVPLGLKYPAGWVGWQNTSFEQTQQPEYWGGLLAAARRGGNIGVLLGPASGGLSTIDLDRNELIAPFLERNPALAKTTRSRGRNGCQFWFYPSGTYPDSKSNYEIKDAAGNHCGEWRCGGGQKGAQSIIFGIHPQTRAPYELLLDQPARGIDFSGIRLLDGWALEQSKRREHPTRQGQPKPRCRVVATSDILTDRDRKRIQAYIASIPGAVSGNGGHNQTFKVALALIQGWGLTPDQAFPFLDGYSDRCVPPWSDAELWHKLNDAGAAEDEGVRGYLRREGDLV